MYLSQQRSVAAHDLLATRKLPPLENSPKLTRKLPTTGPLPAELGQRQANPMPQPVGQPARHRDVTGYRAVGQTNTRLSATARACPSRGTLCGSVRAGGREEEDVSPFTGNLPSINKTSAGIGSGRTPSRYSPQPAPSPTRTHSTLLGGTNRSSTTSAKLPTPAVNGNSKERRSSRNLWSYSEKLPAVNNGAAATKRQRKQGQFLAPSPVKQQDNSR